jgi:hypothetical protein
VVGESGVAFGEDRLTICVLVVAGCSSGGATLLNRAAATALHAISRHLRRLVVPVERATHLGARPSGGTAASESQGNASSQTTDEGQNRPADAGQTCSPPRASILIDTPPSSAIDFPLVRNGFRLVETLATAT